ncbi:MAG: Fur family transcriptional regulator [Azospirillaceae bacterium]|nr:Fur family transcriptional regulator [Azospirillaceae bacterium]
MNRLRPFTAILDRLQQAGLRPTRQRLGLARLLFQHGDRHITAEQLHAEAMAANLKVSLATVYNTVNQFTAAGLLREVVVDSGRSYFDTNMSEHHHFFLEENGELHDILDQNLLIGALPAPPPGTEVTRVDVIIRVRSLDVPEQESAFVENQCV